MSRYEGPINKIKDLKIALKNEIQSRQIAEERFREMISDRSEHILNQFTVEYLNKMQAMKEVVR